MNRNTLCVCAVLLVAYLTLVFCEERGASSEQSTASTELIEEARTRKRHGLHHHLWGWHALAIAYWIKVKVVIVSFFVGSAIFLGLRYFWPHKCAAEITHEGPIIYDHHPHSYDHVPYSLDHSPSTFSSNSFGPYAGYDGGYSDVEPSHFSDIVGPTAASSPHIIEKRAAIAEKRQRRPMKTEEQIAQFMFQFLGLDSTACRKRFICEMEFRSKYNPLTDMAFRIVGRGFFERYTNDHNENGTASSFQECALVNAECEFIEQTEDADEQPPEQHTESEANEQGAAESNDIPSGDVESQNTINLAAERRGAIARKRRRGDRKLHVVAEHILAQNTAL